MNTYQVYASIANGSDGDIRIHKPFLLGETQAETFIEAVRIVGERLYLGNVHYVTDKILDVSYIDRLRDSTNNSKFKDFKRDVRFFVFDNEKSAIDHYESLFIRDEIKYPLLDKILCKLIEYVLWFLIAIRVIK